MKDNEPRHVFFTVSKTRAISGLNKEGYVNRDSKWGTLAEQTLRARLLTVFKPSRSCAGEDGPVEGDACKKCYVSAGFRCASDETEDFLRKGRISTRVPGFCRLCR